MAHRVLLSVVQGKAKANPDPCVVCHDCEVHWELAGGARAFKVEFDKNACPFDNNVFDTATPKSGQCRKKPGPGNKDRFKYTVTVDGVVADPEVIVDGGP